MSRTSPRIAVVGAGGWGTNHVKTWTAIGSLATVCDPDPDRRAAVAQVDPHVPVVADYDTVLSDDTIDGIVLATPAPTHAAMALSAIRAGKDVLVEKPLALEVADGELVVAEAERAGRIAMVGHVLEYHPAFQELVSIVRSGRLGRLRYVYSNRLNFGKIRTNEDALWSFAPHDIALLLRLVGESPNVVGARGGSYVTHTVADATMMTLGFPSGVEGHIYVSWLHPFKEQRLVVVGSAAMAVFEDTRDWGEKLSIYRHDIAWHQGLRPETLQAAPEYVPVEERAPLEEECRAFSQAIVSRVPPLATAATGVETLRVLQAGAKSMAEGGVPQESSATAPAAPEYYAHPSAWVDDGAQIGRGTKIWHNVHVMPGARIGRNCSFGQNGYVASTAVVGDNARVQNNVSIYDGVELGDNVFCGPSMVFTNVVNPRAGFERKDEYAPTRVGSHASIGANATIVCGHEVGEYAFVGAGAVVASDVPPHGLVVGVPARLAGWVSHAGRVLEFDRDGRAVCEESGYRYLLTDDGLRSVPLETDHRCRPQ